MHPERAAEDPKNYGTELVNHWTKETFSTPQGKIITEAFRKAQNLLDIEYLEGNHDNYLTKSSPEYPADTWSAPHAMPGRSPDYHGQGIFMEHGHQCDSSNGNDAGTLPSDWAIGTNSPFGLFLTQLAFLRPKSMREFEPKASGLLDTLQRAPGQRLKQMAYAGDCFYYNRNPFYVYAMGHTHAACLSTVYVSTNAKPTAAESYSAGDQAKKARLFFDENPTWRRTGEEKAVTLHWDSMPGGENCDWISLEDPASPDKTWKKGLRTWVGKGNTSGSQRITNIPPGRYVLRGYLEPNAAAPFVRSTTPCSIEGLSIEGTQESPQDGAFTVKEGKSNRPIVLRWAYHPAGFDPQKTWFSVYQVHEPNQRSKEQWASVPWRRLKQIMAPHPDWGRWVLPREFLQYLEKQPGIWQLRMFKDDEALISLGTVGIFILPG